MDSGDVYVAGRLVAHVTRQPQTTTCEYDADHDGPALVPHLPAGTTTWPAGALPPLLSNLLPEWRRLEAFAELREPTIDEARGHRQVPAENRRRAARILPGGPPSLVRRG